MYQYRRRTLSLPRSFATSIGCDKFRWVQIFPARHVHRAPESTTNYLSSDFVEDGGGRQQTSDGAKNVPLSFSSSSRIPFAISHASLQVRRSSFKVSSWDRSSNSGSTGLRSWSSECWVTPWDGPFLCLRGVEKCTLRFSPKNFVTFRKIQMDSAALYPGKRNLLASNSSIKATEPFPPLFFGFLLGWLSTSLYLNVRFSPDLLVICNFWHTGGCPISFQGNFCTVFGITCQKDCKLLEISLSKNFFRHSVSAVLQQERTIVLPFHGYS